MRASPCASLLALALALCLLPLCSNAQGPYSYNWGSLLVVPSNYDTPSQVGGTVINLMGDSLAGIRPGSMPYSIQVNIPAAVTTLSTIVFGTLRLNPSTGLYSIVGSYEFTVTGRGVLTFVVPEAARWSVLPTDNMATWYRPSASGVQKNFYPAQATGTPQALVKQWVLPFSSIPAVGGALPGPTNAALGRTMPLTYTILPPFDSYAPLNLVNPATFWPTGRTRYAMTSHRGQLVTTGGLYPMYLPEGSMLSDMCSSPDRGIDWTCTPKNSFPTRAGHYIAEFLRPNALQPSLFVVGGYTWDWRPVTPVVNPLSDSWFYDDASEAWVPAQQNVPFAARDGASLISCTTDDQPSMYIMGGWLFASQAYDNQVWTTNDGILWTQVAVTAPFTARADASVSVIAGGTAVVLAGGRDAITVFSDVWISNSGLTAWRRLTDAAPWGPRFGMSMVSHSGLLYAIGGSSASSASFSDVWTSADEGRSWQLITSNGNQMAPRALASTTVIGSQLIVMGGVTWNVVTEEELKSADEKNVYYLDVRASTVASDSHKHKGNIANKAATIRSRRLVKPYGHQSPIVRLVTTVGASTFQWKSVDDTWDMYI